MINNTGRSETKTVNKATQDKERWKQRIRKRRVKKNENREQGNAGQGRTKEKE